MYANVQLYDTIDRGSPDCQTTNRVNVSANEQNWENCMATEQEDRRIRRTKERLRNGLLQLLLEKPYKAISVQNILDAADVSRAAFYSHYQDKDDLLLSGIPTNVIHFDEMADVVLLPSVAPIFAHVSEGQAWLEKMQGTAVMQMLNERSRLRLVENWLAHFERVAAAGLGQVEPAGPLAFYLTGALWALMGWWIRDGMCATPDEMNDLFRQMTLPGLEQHVRSAS